MNMEIIKMWKHVKTLKPPDHQNPKMANIMKKVQRIHQKYDFFQKLQIAKNKNVGTLL
jgi:hypothetical protein